MSWYVVYRGHVPGVYDDWEACRRQVHRFPGNSYKRYDTQEEAEARYANYAGQMYRAGERRRRQMTKTTFVMMMMLIVSAMFYMVLV